MTGVHEAKDRLPPAGVLPAPEFQLGLMPGLSALPRLAAAVKQDGNPDLLAVRAEFESCNGTIVNSYFAPNSCACALLVKQQGTTNEDGESEPEQRRLLIWIDRRDVAMRHPPFMNALWRTFWLARRTEHEAKNVLTRRTRNLCLDMLFDVAVILLGTVDSATSTDKPATEPLQRATAIADDDLDRIEQFADRGAIHRTFRHYLLGLPVGLLLLAIPIFVTEQLLPIAEQEQHLVTFCLIGGGIGAMTSVMVRITRGQRLSVDVNQGGFVTFLAGMFRPVIGAVFGVAFYFLLEGGLIPIATDDNRAHFYGGLSFIAGFTERWAQDMIVRSAPVAPSPVTTAGRSRPDTGPRTSDSGKPAR
ncbi:hypothetical protein [Paractinoplanes toevensis]|uniref:Uncharacterized protein n=1 Tax=Paractinoplanes toevensis TaxID=571911 RepID=A0A919W455_9ACTN|nr:hypothetical protein [Actinoplanes toevensis]GIM89733.1 hypothetical protein Ato02nite_015260 [Actinoplanes toevensis]